MKNLAKQYKGIPEWEEALTTLFNNELSENGETVGWEHSSTVLEQYNTSLLVSGQLKNAIVADGNGDLRVVLEGGPGALGFDNPNTVKVETAENYQNLLIEGKLKTIKLSEMEFIKPAGTKMKNLGNDHLSDLTDQGTRGVTLTDQELAVFGDDFGTALETMDNRNFMSYMFDGRKFKFREDNGTSISIVDKLIKDNTAEWDSDESGGLDEAETAAAKEVIKAKILDGSYNKQRVIDLFHNKAKQAYHDKKEIYDTKLQANKGTKTTLDANYSKIRSAANGSTNVMTFSSGAAGVVTFVRVGDTDTFQGSLKDGSDYGTFNLDELMSQYASNKNRGQYVDEKGVIEKQKIQQEELNKKKKEQNYYAPYTTLEDVETIALSAEDPDDDEYLINVFKAKYPDFTFTNDSNLRNSIKVKYKKGTTSSVVAVDDDMYSNLTIFMNDQVSVNKQKLPK